MLRSNGNGHLLPAAVAQDSAALMASVSGIQTSQAGHIPTSRHEDSVSVLILQTSIGYDISSSAEQLMCCRLLVCNLPYMADPISSSNGSFFYRSVTLH